MHIPTQAVGALIQLLRASAEAERPLRHELRLEDSDLVVDEGVAVMPAAPAAAPPVPREKARNDVHLTVAQAGALCARFRAQAAGPTVPLPVALDILLAAIAADDLPAAWRRLDRQTIAALCEAFPATATAGDMCWPKLVVRLAGLEAKTAADITAAADALAEASDRATRATRAQWMASRTYLDEEPSLGAGESEEAVFNLSAVRALAPAVWQQGIGSLTPHLWDGPSPPRVTQARKELLFGVFCDLAGPDDGSTPSEPTIDWEWALMYLAASLAAAQSLVARQHEGMASLHDLARLLHRDLGPAPVEAQPGAWPEPADPRDPVSTHVLSRCVAPGRQPRMEALAD